MVGLAFRSIRISSHFSCFFSFPHFPFFFPSPLFTICFSFPPLLSPKTDAGAPLSASGNGGFLRDSKAVRRWPGVGGGRQARARYLFHGRYRYSPGMAEIHSASVMCSPKSVCAIDLRFASRESSERPPDSPLVPSCLQENMTSVRAIR